MLVYQKVFLRYLSKLNNQKGEIDLDSKEIWQGVGALEQKRNSAGVNIQQHLESMRELSIALENTVQFLEKTTSIDMSNGNEIREFAKKYHECRNVISSLLKNNTDGWQQITGIINALLRDLNI